MVHRYYSSIIIVPWLLHSEGIFKNFQTFCAFAHCVRSSGLTGLGGVQYYEGYLVSGVERKFLRLRLFLGDFLASAPRRLLDYTFMIEGASGALRSCEFFFCPPLAASLCSTCGMRTIQHSNLVLCILRLLADIALGGI